MLWAGHQTKHNMGAAFCDTVRSAPNNCCTDGVVRKVVLCKGRCFFGAGHCCWWALLLMQDCGATKRFFRKGVKQRQGILRAADAAGAGACCDPR